MKLPKLAAPRTPRVYEPLWNKIKQLWPAEVPVKVHVTAVARVRQAVRKEKSREVAFMRTVGELTYGPLVDRVQELPADKDHVVLWFKITYNEKDV